VQLNTTPEAAIKETPKEVVIKVGFWVTSPKAIFQHTPLCPRPSA